MADILSETQSVSDRLNNKLERFIEIALNNATHRETVHYQLMRQMADQLKSRKGMGQAYTALVPAEELKVLDRYMDMKRIPHIAMDQSVVNGMAMIIVDKSHILELQELESKLRQLTPGGYRMEARVDDFLDAKEAGGEDISFVYKFDDEVSTASGQDAKMTRDNQFIKESLQDKLYNTGAHEFGYTTAMMNYVHEVGKDGTIESMTPLMILREQAVLNHNKNDMSLLSAITETGFDRVNTIKELTKNMAHDVDRLMREDFTNNIEMHEDCYLCDAYNESPMYLHYDSAKDAVFSYVPETGTEAEVLCHDTLEKIRESAKMNGKFAQKELYSYISGVTGQILNMTCVFPEQYKAIQAQTRETVHDAKRHDAETLIDKLEEVGSILDNKDIDDIAVFSIDDIERADVKDFYVRPDFSSDELLEVLDKRIGDEGIVSGDSLDHIVQGLKINAIENYYKEVIKDFVVKDRGQYKGLQYDEKTRAIKVMNDIKLRIKTEHDFFQDFMNEDKINEALEKSPLNNYQNISTYLKGDKTDITLLKGMVKDTLISMIDRVDVYDDKTLRKMNNESNKLVKVSEKIKGLDKENTKEQGEKARD